MPTSSDPHGQEVTGETLSPPQALVAAISAVAVVWLESALILTAARQLGCETADLDPGVTADLVAAAERHGAQAIAEVTALLNSDVDAQRSNPLAVLRATAIAAGQVLAEHRIPPVVRDDFEVNAFPEDRYRLVPASWVDVDPSLQDPGITWGAWKAAQVLQRRRAEGLR